MRLIPSFRGLIGLVCLIGLVVPGVAQAQRNGAPIGPAAPIETVTVAPESTALHLKTGKVEVMREVSLHQAKSAPLSEAGHYVTQLDGNLTKERLEALRAAGIELGQYLPSNAYVVHLDEGFNVPEKLGHLDFVRWVGSFDKQWKLDPEIGQQMFQTQERIDLANQDISKLCVVLFDGADLNDAVQKITALPGVTLLEAGLNGGTGMMEITLPQGQAAALAEIDAVQWVEEAGEATYRNDTNGWILQSYVANARSIWDRGLRGEGQVGGLIDGAVRQTHCSFTAAGKIVAYFGNTGSDSHGTHTAGTFVGDERPGNGIGFRGMAYLAKLAFTNLGSVSSTNFYSRLEQNRNAGARIHSNSWGNDNTTSYTNWTRDIDRFSHDFEDDLVLFAITNINGLVRTPENAKNCLAVAATNDFPANNHCSGGFAPTNDGRQKPELMAPGCSTISSQASTTCGFTGSGFTGTSMACPAVAGAGLLVRQYFIDGYYPTGTANGFNSFVPSGALIRATLINSGSDVLNIAGFPSTREGWGRVLLENALHFSGQNRRLMVLDDRRNAQGMMTGEVTTYRISCYSTGEPLKVTLVWTEQAAALNANPAYINNLNLEVISPNNATYLGNVFSNGQSAPGGTADFRNNVEQALFNIPLIGRYTIRVRAATVNTPIPQGYALVVTGAVKELDFEIMAEAVVSELE